MTAYGHFFHRKLITSLNKT